MTRHKGTEEITKKYLRQEEPHSVLVPSEAFLSSLSMKTYHEMADIPVIDVDILEQFDGHIQTLIDLKSRLQFVNREIRYLMRI